MSDITDPYKSAVELYYLTETPEQAKEQIDKKRKSRPWDHDFIEWCDKVQFYVAMFYDSPKRHADIRTGKVRA